jgi:predicted 3-demethylubiquinone-9 3-methyltransferase (glyoxalase superfamily)
MRQLTPHLWFDNEAEEAANFYTSVFKNSKIHSVVRYPEAAKEVSGKQPGSVMTVEFEIEGQRFVALNGGPEFKFSEAISFMIPCKDQKEVDYFWSRLTEGGEESVCGWLKDKFGLSWQVVPERLNEMLEDKNTKKVEAVTQSFLQMKKLDLAALEQAYKAA